MIIAVAFFGLLVIVGLAIDLGLMYIERIRLGRACDAAALAGAQELPYEEQAAARAIEYLDENGYELRQDLGLTVIGPESATTLPIRRLQEREASSPSAQSSRRSRLADPPTC